MNNVRFDDLREANLLRCEASFKHCIDDWTYSDWAMAVAGELGEACNLLKKLRRGEDIPLVDIGDELADTVIYLDLLAQVLELDLGACVKKKFNAVSFRVGSDITLS